jgi:hypothetical protein
MNHTFAFILAVAGWYLLYPPATQNTDPGSQTPGLSSWVIDGSYGTAADCEAAHGDDLNSMLGLEENSHHDNAFLQTRAGRCVASDDPRLPE